MNKDIVMSRELLKRLVIVDDSSTTYNAFKSKCLDSELIKTFRQYDKGVAV